MTRIFKLLLISSLLIIVGCSKDDPITEDKNKPLKITTLEGKVEKGPFTQGSTVTIRELNKDLLPTGKTFETEIINNKGEFKLEAAVEFVSPYVQIACDGYFFNEIYGELSDSQIRLESIVDISNKRSININILTHLSKDRVIRLMKEGDSYKDATSKARKDLLTSFGLQKYKDTEFENWSISSGEKNSGALIVISSILLKDRDEAELTEHIAKLKETFTNEGKFPESVIKSFRDDSYKLDLNRISSNIVERYEDLGETVTVPNLNYYIDWDEDGIAGNEFGDPNVESKISLEVDTLYVGKEGGEFSIPIDANIPFTLHPKSNDPLHSISFPDIIFNKIELTNIGLTDNNLILKVAPTNYPLLKPEVISVYSYNGELSTSVTIIQEGDFSDELSNPILHEIVKRATFAFDYSYTIEGLYSNCYTTSDYSWEMFENHQINSSNSIINTAWRSLYTLNSTINTVDEYVDDKYSTYIVPLRALLYYHLTSLWGNVPYFTHVIDPSEASEISRTSTFDIYSSLQKQLERCIVKHPLENDGVYFNVSKNVPRALLAKILMEQNKHSEALVLLEEIISSKMYVLNNSRDEALSSSSTEMIYAIDTDMFPTTNFSNIIETNRYLPLVQYSEVVLMAAECSNKTGNKSKAIDYLNQIRSKDGLSSASHSTFNDDLKETWKNRMKGGFSYFQFLKRNNLATVELDIQDYQKLMPIPWSEINSASNMTQNPGY